MRVLRSSARARSSRSRFCARNKCQKRWKTKSVQETAVPETRAVEEEREIHASNPVEAVRDYAEENRSSFVVPPMPMNGVAEDLSGKSFEELVKSHDVYNHELSWLAFNWRVLAVAMDRSVPLFERLRFVAISSRNLDEFFAKRVGGLKRQQAAGVENLKVRTSVLWTPDENLLYIAEAVKELLCKTYEVLVEDIIPSLLEHSICLFDYEELTSRQKSTMREHFVREIEPLLTPLAVDPGHPFPYIGSLSLSLAVELQDPLDDERYVDFAIVTIPSNLPRFIRIPTDEGYDNHFITVEQVIKNNLDRLFGGMVIISCTAFRATRNADVERNEDEADDLLEMIIDELRDRRFSKFVRLEVEDTMPPDIVSRLVDELMVDPKLDVYYSQGLLGLEQLDSIPVYFGRGVDENLEFVHAASQTHPRLIKNKGKNTSMFSMIRKGDILVHHPYHAFATSTQAFVEQAAKDPSVVAIKATLYRTSSDSPIISALIKAAENGKQVAVLVELKARFDEARNVGIAQKLEDAGCNVAYGLIGLKIHCKTTMVIRREKNEYRTYCHIGTGNYNPSTASIYTDYGLLTCDPVIGKDVSDLFKFLTGYHHQQSYKKLLVAPNFMRKQFSALMDKEIERARRGEEASITIKLNGLDDKVMTSKLYEASCAGVMVNLIIRGVCQVRPGIPGVSDNIRVVSIIGRYLEHHRVYRFHNGGDPLFYFGSSDWMTRNLLRRVEVVVPIEDTQLQKQIQDMLEAALHDKFSAWELGADGRWRKPPPPMPKDAPREQYTTFGKKPCSLAKRAGEVGLQTAIIERTAKESKEAKRAQKKAIAALKKKAAHKLASAVDFYNVTQSM